MAFTISNPFSGFQSLTTVDAGVVPANNTNTGSTTTVPTPPAYPGMVIVGIDPTFGGGEFILLAGVASTIVGSLVTYNDNTFLTTLAPVTANLGQPVAFAMSANVAATTWGWYQIGGCAVAAKSTGITFAPRVALGVNSIGKVGAVASGKQVLGARTANAATVASATTTVRVLIDRPHMQGRIT